MTYLCLALLALCGFGIPESPTSAGTFRFRGNAYCLDADGKLFESINTAGPHVDTSEKCLAVLSEYFGSNPFFIGMSQYSKYCSGHFVGGKVGQTEDLTIPNLPLLVDNLNKRTAWGGYQWYYHIRNGDSLSTEMSSPSTFGEDTSATVPNAAVQRCYDYTVQPASETVSPTMVPTESPTMEPTLNPSLSPDLVVFRGGNADLSGAYFIDGTRDGKPLYKASNGARIEYWSHSSQGSAWWWVDSSGEYVWSSPFKEDVSSITPYQWTSFHGYGVAPAPSFKEYDLVAYRGGNSDVNFGYVIDGTRDGKPVYKASNGAKIEYWSHSSQGSAWWWVDASGEYIWSAPYREDISSIIPNQWTSYHGFGVVPAPSFNEHELNAYRGGNIDLNVGYNVDGQRDGKPLYKASNGARIEYWATSHFLGSTSAWWWVNSAGQYVWYAPSTGDISIITPNQWTSYEGKGVGIAPSFHPNLYVAFGAGNNDLNGAYIPNGLRDGKPLYQASNGAKIEYWSHSSQGSAWWWVDSSGNYCWSTPFTEDLSSIVSEQWTPYHHFGVGAAPSFYGSNYAEQPISGRRMLMGSEANALIKSSAQARKH